MKTAKTVTVSVATRSALVAGGTALLVLGAAGFTTASHARENVSFSIGVGVPGVVVGVNNAYPVYTQPVYAQPVYVQPQPVYVQPRPVYIQPLSVYGRPVPVYVQPAPLYYQSAPVYYGRPHGHRHHGAGYYVQTPRPAHGSGFSGQRHAPVYYQR